MKKIILFIILFFTLNISYASFPVEKNNNNVTIINDVEETPVFSITSIISVIISVLYLFFGGPEGLTLSLIFSIIAMVLGVIGLKKKNKNLSLVGFSLGLVLALLSSIFLIIIKTAVSVFT